MKVTNNGVKVLNNKVDIVGELNNFSLYINDIILFNNCSDFTYIKDEILAIRVNGMMHAFVLMNGSHIIHKVQDISSKYIKLCSDAFTYIVDYNLRITKHPF